MRRYRDPSNAVFHCAELQEDRTVKMVEYANVVAMIQESVTNGMASMPGIDAAKSIDVQKNSFVRQRGGLSSFHIPNVPLRSDEWQKRYSPRRTSRHHCRIQREERRALERHARKAGCRIIVNPELSRIDEFDEEFETLCDKEKWLPSNSREKAIQHIREQLKRPATPSTQHRAAKRRTNRSTTRDRK